MSNHPHDESCTSFVPSITIDGMEYYSDRFYLNRGVGDPPVATLEEEECTCGARAPPPLLDRGRLVAGLSLEAAVLASYNVAPSHLIKEFPSLFGPDSNVPTLVLHGHKGLSERLNASKRRANEDSRLSSQESNQSSPGGNNNGNKRARFVAAKTEVDDDSDVVCIDHSSDGEDEDDVYSSRIKSEDDDVAVKEEEPPEDVWLRKQNESIATDKYSFGKSVHFTEVLPTWLSPQAKHNVQALQRQQEEAKKTEDDTDVIVLDSDDEEMPVDARYGVDPLVVQHRQAKRGVHHPKYMLLFETSGSVVVVVTSANLTPQHAVDASWVQRFQPLESSNDASGDTVTDAMRCDGSDFGFVLANYLECQSLAARPGEMIPEVFLERFAGLASLDDFRRRYRWNSQVHLVATVPGEYRGPQTATHLGEIGADKSFLYGSQRVSDILRRLSTPSTATSRQSQTALWLPQELLSNDDRLVIQPTSFGGYWKQSSLRDLLRLYHEQGLNTTTATDTSPGHDLLDQTDIVWPSRDYMATLDGKRKRGRVPSPDSVASVKTDIAADSSVDVETGGNFCFLSSVSFNTIEFPCISRMTMFEPSYPHQNPSNRSPHIKSFVRVFEGDEYQLRKHYNIEKAGECLSWFMLTSACLSRGAQGEAAPHRPSDSDAMTFSNFELGVLFVSRLTKNIETDRLYCWKPNKCHCNQPCHSSGQSRTQLIHLPLPYSLRPRAYLDDTDETDLAATPYFHEIPRGTGFVGHMARTPLGARLAAARL